MSESTVENQTNNSTDAPHAEENDKKEKPARKSKPRLSLAERAAKESQEILKSMGVKDSGDETGRRRTRSSTKPPVEPAPSPPKRERKTPAPKAEKKEAPKELKEKLYDQRIVIKFLSTAGRNGPQIIQDLEKVYGVYAFKGATVFKWLKRFREGRESVDDDARPGRPTSSKTVENIGRVEAAVLKDSQRKTIRKLAEELNIGKDTVHAILRQLGYKDKFWQFDEYRGAKGGRGRGRKGSKKDEDEEEENNKDHSGEDKDESKVENKDEDVVNKEKDEKMDVDESKGPEEKSAAGAALAEENGQLENETKEESSSKKEDDADGDKREEGEKTTTKESTAPEPSATETSQPDAEKTNE